METPIFIAGDCGDLLIAGRSGCVDNEWRKGTVGDCQDGVGCLLDIIATLETDLRRQL